MIPAVVHITPRRVLMYRGGKLERRVSLRVMDVTRRSLHDDDHGLATSDEHGSRNDEDTHGGYGSDDRLKHADDAENDRRQPSEQLQDREIEHALGVA